MTEIINQQQTIPLPEGLGEFSEAAGRLVFDAAETAITVVFVDNKRITELNSSYRGRNEVTDVLSFTYQDDEPAVFGDLTGDIVISVEKARSQARENGLDLATEIQQLILHGMLHLRGYDHNDDDGEMNDLELRFRKDLGIE